MLNQVNPYTYDINELLERRTKAEKLLVNSNSISKEQRQQLLNLIRAIDAKLNNCPTTVMVQHPMPNTAYYIPMRSAGGKEAVIEATMASTENDASNTGLNIISFLIPLVGLILYLIYHEKSPHKAKAIGKAALIGFCLSTLMSVLSTVLLLGL